MKKTLLLFILIGFIISLAQGAIEISDVKLGGPNQIRGVNITSAVSIKNNEPSKIKKIDVSFSGVNPIYKVESKLSSPTIEPQGSISLEVKGYVPLDLDAVDSKGKKITHDIGDIIIKFTYENNSVVTKNINLFMEAENKLRFSSSKIKINDGSEKTLKDGKTFSDLYRKDKITITTKIENAFSDSGKCSESRKCDIKRIKGYIKSKDSDMDVDEGFGFSSLDADDTDTDTIDFTIPDDIEDGSYDFEMYVTGEDENGALHGDYWQFELDVSVNKDDIRIIKYSLEPSVITCEREVTLSVTLENVGSNDQDEASIFVDSSKLDLMESIYDIVLDEGQTKTRTLYLKLPEKIAPATYNILVRANVERNKEKDRVFVPLIVKECKQNTTSLPSPTLPTTPSTNNTNGQITINQTYIPPTAGVIYGRPKQQQTTTSGDTISVLILAGLFVIALLLLLILVVMISKR